MQAGRASQCLSHLACNATRSSSMDLSRAHLAVPLSGRAPLACQAWEANGLDTQWCRAMGMDIRGMRFALNVRKQLEGITGPEGEKLTGQAAEAAVPGSAGDPSSTSRRQEEPARQGPSSSSSDRPRGWERGDGPDTKRRRLDDRGLPMRSGADREGAGGTGSRLWGWRDRDRERGEGRVREQDGSGPRGGAGPVPRAAVRRGRKQGDGAVALRQAILIGFASQLARRLRHHDGCASFCGSSMTLQAVSKPLVLTARHMFVVQVQQTYVCLLSRYKTLRQPSTLAQLHPSSARLPRDTLGLPPEWVVYHQLVATSSVFLAKVGPDPTLTCWTQFCLSQLEVLTTDMRSFVRSAPWSPHGCRY